MNQSTRTKTAIMDGFLSLLNPDVHEEDISLKEILDSCLVTKSTFYRHFKDKQDLIRFCFSNFSKEMYFHTKCFFLGNESEMDFILYLNLKKMKFRKLCLIRKEKDMNRFFLERHFLENNEEGNTYFGDEIFSLLYSLLEDEQPCKIETLKHSLSATLEKLNIQIKEIGGKIN